LTTVLDALNRALHSAMEQDERVFVIGEDILDPYGGAFKVTRGLSTRFPDRVLTTPISEAAITGLATGMALRGLWPVVEIMFGDFLTLACDQIVNHAAKFRCMYNNQTRVPLVVRTPMGGRRGYGPTHSQSIEKHWLGVPGLRVIALNTFTCPQELLMNAILTDKDPVLFIEHKLLYSAPVRELSDANDFQVRVTGFTYPTAVLSFRSLPRTDLTFACYGYMADLVSEAMLQLLFEYEIFSEAVIYTQLSPLNVGPLLKSVTRTRYLITVEEGGKTSGWGSEVISNIVGSTRVGQPFAARCVAALDSIVPSARVLEDQVLPSVDDIVNAALDLLEKER
jgi:pyruvate/2-oxoglutarate/acetoin dehydrogenase E1 component